MRNIPPRDVLSNCFQELETQQRGFNLKNCNTMFYVQYAFDMTYTLTAKIRHN